VVSEEEIRQAISNERVESRIYVEGSRVYLSYERMCEVKSAKRIVSMILQEGFTKIDDLDSKIDNAERTLHQRLAPSQRNAVKLCLSHPISIMTGGPGSGKTITAVKIAKMLSARKKNVILLLCDMAAPMLPCICPADALESNGSLAGVLAAARISENLIKHNLVTFKRNSCLAVLGLLERQNEYSTPPFTQKQVVELLDGLRQIAPYVIVDCGSYIANDILSAVALMEADSILRLANCDPKSVNYFASQLPLLDGPEWDMDKQYKVASNVKPYQAADHIGKVLGDAAFVLPYSQELEEQYLAGNLLADLTLKDSRPFRKELDRIIAEVF